MPRAADAIYKNIMQLLVHHNGSGTLRLLFVKQKKNPVGAYFNCIVVIFSPAGNKRLRGKDIKKIRGEDSWKS